VDSSGEDGAEEGSGDGGCGPIVGRLEKGPTFEKNTTEVVPSTRGVGSVLMFRVSCMQCATASLFARQTAAPYQAPTRVQE
jgi:hypothetical protein